MGAMGKDRTPALLKSLEAHQKLVGYNDFKKNQRAQSERYNYQLERDRLRSHLETHRLPGLHGVMSRLASIDRILGQVNDHVA